jgi:hypothetical protein
VSIMNELESFASFLKAYGAYAMSSVFAFLYFLERRERRVTQDKFEVYLSEASSRVLQVLTYNAKTAENLKDALAQAGVLHQKEDNDA